MSAKSKYTLAARELDSTSDFIPGPTNSGRKSGLVPTSSKFVDPSTGTIYESMYDFGRGYDTTNDLLNQVDQVRNRVQNRQQILDLGLPPELVTA